MKNKFGYLVGFSALAISVCAAVFSITGLSQLFSGAATAVIFLTGFLEFAKVISTIVLHNYWNKLTRSLKFYLSTGVVILMLITSLGIYGFLASAYSANKNKFEIHNGQINILNNKKEIFNKSIKSNQEIIDNKNKRIATLTNLRNNQETRLDSAKTTRNKDKVRKDIKEANDEIIKLTNDIDLVTNKISVLNDSIGKYDIKVLESNSNSDISREIGSLKYISDITGLPMDSVVNYLILLLIFVFDPLAIALIIATNKIFELNSEKKEIIKDLINSPVELGIKEMKPKKTLIERFGLKKEQKPLINPELLKEVEKNFYGPSPEEILVEASNKAIQEEESLLKPTEDENKSYQNWFNEQTEKLFKEHFDDKINQEESNSYESEDTELVKEEYIPLVNDTYELPKEEIIEIKPEETPIIEEPIVQPEIKEEQKKIQLEDIAEKKINRNFSVDIPNPAKTKISRY